jgi:ketosteroid isomerase-like protein
MNEIPAKRREPVRLGVAAWFVAVVLGCVGSAMFFVPAMQVQAAAQADGKLHHEPRHAEREQIEALEEQFRKAQLDGDVATMDKLLSEDYLGINANGELVTKTQQLDHMRNRTLMLTQLDTSDVKIKINGSTAIVTSLVQVEGTLDATALRGRYRYTRIYQRLPNGAWKVTNFETTRIRRSNE